MNTHAYNIFICLFAVILFFLSYSILPLYTLGDVHDYRNYYQSVENLSVFQCYLMATSLLGTMEPIHAIVVYLFNVLGLEYDLAVASINTLLAISFISYVKTENTLRIIYFLLLLLSFYFAVLFTELERLKIAFLFFFLSRSVNNKLYIIIFVTLAILSHVQILLLYLGIYLPFCVQSLTRLRNLKLSKNLLIGLILTIVIVTFLFGHISTKLEVYISRAGNTIFDVAKGLVFLLPLIKKRTHAMLLLQFAPILCVIALIGGNRLNILLYFLLLDIVIQQRLRLSLRLSLINLYFLLKSVDFYDNILTEGRGYDFSHR